jgi:hypothetical protein
MDHPLLLTRPVLRTAHPLPRGARKKGVQQVLLNKQILDKIPDNKQTQMEQTKWPMI